MDQRIGVCVLAVLLAAAGEAQEVRLPLNQFEELRARARPVPSPPPVIRLPVALEAADLTLKAGARSASVLTRLTVAVAAPGPHLLPLHGLGALLAVRCATADVRVEPGERPRLAISGEGRHTVVVESAVAVAEGSPPPDLYRRLQLELPPAAVVTGRVEAPADIENVSFHKGALARPAATPHVWEFAGERGAQLEVGLAGHSRLADRQKLPVRFKARTAAILRPTRTRQTVEGWVRLDVLQGLLERARLPLPEGFDVAAVEGTGLGSWDVRDGRLEVVSTWPRQRVLEFKVRLLGPAQDLVDSPLLIPDDADEVRAITGVAMLGEGEPALLEPAGARAPSAEELAALPAGFVPPGAHLRATASAAAHRWQLRWGDAGEALAAQADRLLADVLWGGQASAACQYWIVVRSAGQEHLAITPPAGFTPTAVTRDGAPVAPGRQGAALTVALAAGEQAQVVHLSGLLRLEAAPAALAVPLPSLSVNVARVEVRLTAPGDREYGLSPGRAGAAAEPPASGKEGAARPALARGLEPSAPVSRPEGPMFFSAPPGYVTVQAAWTALRAAPESLSLSVRARRAKEEWF